MKYKHLTREQRLAISRLLTNGISQKQIALSIHVSPSTVCREIKRNFSKHKYSASGAQEWDDVRKERLLSNHAIKPTIKRKSYISYKNISGRLISISNRPKEADGTRFGDWEMDTILLFILPTRTPLGKKAISKTQINALGNICPKKQISTNWMMKT